MPVNNVGRASMGLVVACLLIVLLPLGLPAMGAPAADAELAPLDEAVKACTERVWDPVTILESTEFAQTRASLAAEPGFVDLLVGSDGGRPVVTALFDVTARSEPLPLAPVSPWGVPLEIVGERFEPLVIPAHELDPTWEDAADPPLIPQSCATAIRPGARVSTPVGGCTANFVFTDQANRWYVGTAGHCFSALGQRLTVSGLGQVGTLVYFINQGVGRDFALVQVDADKETLVNPAMCHWGGPAEIAGGTSGSVLHYGHGIGYGQSVYTRPRTGYLSSAGSQSFSFSGTAASGDSGSGANTAAGNGLGVITHVNAGAVIVAHSAPFAYGTRLSYAMELAEGATGLQLTLQTAPPA